MDPLFFFFYLKNAFVIVAANGTRQYSRAESVSLMSEYLWLFLLEEALKHNDTIVSTCFNSIR